MVTIELLGAASVDDAVLIVDSLQSHAHLLSGTDASDELQRLSVLAAKLDAYRVSLVSTIQSSQVWREDDPNGTPASFLRQQHLLDHRQAKADLRSAQSFDRYPELAQACRDGRISRDKVDTILSVGLSNSTREAALGEFIQIFVDLAERVTVSQLRKTMDLWADQVDPLATNNGAADAHRRRELHVYQLGDGVKLDGFFGPEQGMKIMTALNAALSAHRRANPAAADEHPADHNDSEQGNYFTATASAAQRADAFIDAIITPILESGLLPTCGGAMPTVCVTIPLQRLQQPDESADPGQLRRRLADDTLRLHSASINAPNGPGHMLLSTTTAQHISCDAAVQRIVLSPAGKPLDIGRKTRTIPEHIRKALIIRDGGCRFPGCDKPAGWAEGHHIIHWSQGGPTSLDNLVLLCSRHHHQVHADNIPITFDQHGKPQITPRTGTNRWTR